MSLILQLPEQPLLVILGWALLHSLWQGALIALLAGGLLIVLRRCSAQARYVCAVAALSATAAAPVITFCALRHGDGGAAAAGNSAQGAVAARTTRLKPPRGDGRPATDRSATRLPPSQTASLPTASSSSKSPSVEPARAENTAFVREAVALQGGIASGLARRMRLALPWAAVAWICGAAAFALRLAGSWFAAERLKRVATRPVPDRVGAAALRIARRLRIGRPVQVLESALVRVPTAVGWLRPVVLLPAAALTNLSAMELEAMLMHELAHVRRHDYLVNLLQSVVESLLFFHPAVWWLSRRIRIERENCCDDRAVELLGDRASYARALLRMVELASDSPRLAMAASGGELTNRFRRLAGLAPRPVSVGRAQGGALVLSLLFAVAVLLQIASAAADEKEPAAARRPDAPIARQNSKETSVPAAAKDQRENAAKEDNDPPAADAPSPAELWSAARLGQRERLASLVGMRQKLLDQRDEDGFAPLHRAASGGWADAAKLLLELKADPDVQQATYHGTPLQYAASFGHLDVVRVLLKQGASVDSADKFGRTPLMWAAMKGNTEIVRALHSHDANVNAATRNRWTALHYAVKAGHAKTAQALIDAGADFTKRNSQGVTPLDLDPEMKLKLPGKPAPAADRPEPEADKEGGDTGDAKDEEDGKEKEDGKEEKGGAAAADAPSPAELWRAAMQGESKRLASLIGMRQELLNQRDEEGFAPLHRAAMSGRADAARLLLDLKADPGVRQTTYHGAPLQYAAGRGHLDVARLLLKEGASVDSADKFGRTPLMWAAMKGHTEVVRALHSHDANVNAANSGGWTPLHYAVKGGHADAAQALIDAGADFTRRNSQGVTPLELDPTLKLDVPAEYVPPAKRPKSSGGGSETGPGAALRRSDDDSPVVGSVYGKAVTAVDIGLTASIDPRVKFDSRDTARWELMGRILRTFGGPVVDRFVQAQKIEATEDEIKKLERNWMHEQITASPDATRPLVLPRDLAEAFKTLIIARKTERKLHDVYGGRVIFQQAGPEALDARRRLFEAAEKNGDISFKDAGVRHMFYYYYTNMKHTDAGEKALTQPWLFE